MSDKIGYYSEETFVRASFVPETRYLPKVIFSYKPLRPMSAAKFADAVLKDDSTESIIEIQLRIIAEQLEEWDLKKPDGSFVDFTDTEELKKVDPFIVQTVALEIKGRSNEILSEEELKNL